MVAIDIAIVTDTTGMPIMTITIAIRVTIVRRTNRNNKSRITKIIHNKEKVDTSKTTENKKHKDTTKKESKLQTTE